jgi:hypothetical protein
MRLALCCFWVAQRQRVDRAVAGLKPPLFGAGQSWQLNLFDPDASRVEFMAPEA